MGTITDQLNLSLNRKGCGQSVAFQWLAEDACASSSVLPVACQFIVACCYSLSCMFFVAASAIPESLNSAPDHSSLVQWHLARC